MMIAQVNRKWSCDEDGVHMSTKWLPIPRFLRKNEKLFLKRKIKKKTKEELTFFRVRTFSLSGSDFVGAVMGSGGEKSE